MTLEALQFLNSMEGKEILNEYKNIEIKNLPILATALAKKRSPFPAEIVTLLKLRKNATGKFYLSREMFFTNEGLEQASGEKIGEYIANRFKAVIKTGTVTDLTCGIGGNAIFLAKYFSVKAVDINAVHLGCAQFNSSLYGVNQKIKFIHGKAEDNLVGTQAFIIDPQRIRSGKTKTRSLLNSQPDFIKLLPEMLKVTENICVKISPAFDYNEINAIPGNPEVEVVSEEDNNKAALLWFGSFKDAGRKATILDGQEPISFKDQINLASLKYSANFKKYLFIPNKAIIKSELVDEIACQYCLERISGQNEILTSDNLTVYPKRILRSFEVIDYELFSVKNVKRILKKNNLDRAHIIARHFLINAEEMRQRLKLKEGGAMRLF